MTRPVDKLFNKDWKISLWLIISGFVIYFGYYNDVLLNANAVLSGITGDALKNYYTFAFHIKNDAGILNFTGMNFPYGEHVVYTDCQPLLTFLLRLLPFTHNYLIGILHWLLFLSFVFTPLVLHKVFRRLSIDTFSSFFLSIGITLLSPQFGKIFGGHHGLAYGCLIPLSILFLLELIQIKRTAQLIKVCIYNFLLFFIHPYMGFSSSVFTFLTLFVFYISTFRKDKLVRNALSILVGGVLPIVMFKIFMALSDQHLNRTGEPQGLNVLVENISSLLAPDFGPFQHFMESLFTNKVQHLEGHSYLGLFTILFTFLFILVLPFQFKKYFFRKELLALLFSSLVLLFLSFGWHYTVFDILHLKTASLNQFRAVCRFAWVFYYVFPIFLFSVSYHSLELYFERKSIKTAFQVLCVSFFLLNLLEAHFYFRKDQGNFWKFRNVLTEKYLNKEEKEIIEDLKKTKPQAIIALPIFHIGSETYARFGGDNSMIPSMIYSYHANLPILGVSMSRTSITETENEIQLLNSYMKNRAAASLLKDLPFFVIKTNDALLPDEERLLFRFKSFRQNDSLQMGYLSRTELLERKLNEWQVSIDAKQIHPLDTTNLLFIPEGKNKPFINSTSKEYETICIIDSNQIRSGSYILSFHNFYGAAIGKKEFPTFILTRGKGKDYKWQYYQSTRLLSGFYSGFNVFEYNIDLERDCRYEFVLKGEADQSYHISNFMLRPRDMSVLGLKGKDTTFNNFPK